MYEGNWGGIQSLKKSDLFFEKLKDNDDSTDASDNEEVEDPGEGRGQKTKKQVFVTRTQYYRYLLFPWQGKHNTFFLFGKLFHQFVVDCWASTEQNKLDWLRFNQKALRADVYKGLVDAVHSGDRSSLADLGKRFILPSTHINSTRHMFQLFQDSMAICRYFGSADLFITMTANPNWKEIKDELGPHQTVADRPDLLARAFQMKKTALLKRIQNDGIFGGHVASVWTVEFQKRGLPDVHLIFFLKSEHKLRSPDDFVKMIRADIPDPELEPRLHELVAANMMHTCNKKRCLDERGKCNKNFPKPYIERTTMAENGYARIARPDNGHFVKKFSAGQEVLLTN